MKHFVRFYLVVFLLVSDFTLFAQPGNGLEDGGGDDNIEGESGDTTPAGPINSKIILLVITAVLFAFYSYNKKTKRA